MALPISSPYVFFSGGLASESPIDVRNVASKALAEYDAMLHVDEPPLALQHPVTRRFCDPQWVGLDDGDEVPLRPYLERLAQGLVEGLEGAGTGWGDQVMNVLPVSGSLACLICS